MSSMREGEGSVPGLCAKPVIDMLPVVADSADEPSHVSRRYGLVPSAGRGSRVLSPVRPAK